MPLYGDVNVDEQAKDDRMQGKTVYMTISSVT